MAPQPFPSPTKQLLSVGASPAAFADGSSMEHEVILQVLAPSKPKDHSRHLKRRMDTWKEGNFEEILLEGRCIQKHLPKPGRGQATKQPLAKIFQKHMSSGKVNKALRYLSINGVLGNIPDGGTHRGTSLMKNTPQENWPIKTICYDNPTPTHNIRFHNLDYSACLSEGSWTIGLRRPRVEKTM